MSKLLRRKIMSLVALTNLAENEPVPEGYHAIFSMDSTGDSRIIWDPSNPDEVAAARKHYDDLIAKGYQAFSVRPGGKGEKGEKVMRFDPTLEKMIMQPAMVGG
jgi:hypothetical protein